jgi:hypothetical protein
VRRRPGAGRDHPALHRPRADLHPGLRDDRDLAGGAAAGRRARPGQGGLGGGAALLHRCPGGRPGRRRGRARPARRDHRGRPQRDAGVLGAARGDLRGARRRLAALRRRGHHGRGRLRVRGGPHQGRDHFRRGEHLPGGGGERPAQSPRGGRLRGDRHPGRPVG